MKMNRIFFVVAIALVALLAAPHYASAFSISFLGKSGNDNNNITITGSIWSAKTGGFQRWGDVVKSVPKVSGYYTVEFGEVDLPDFNVLFNGQELWLQVDQAGTVLPRLLTISGYSITSSRAATAGVAAMAVDSDTVDGHHMDQDVLTTSSPSFSSVTATTFTGSLTGNADTATSAATATTATTASTADYATSAGSATTATTASTADYATSAGSAATATTASTADYATSAGNAATATSANTATTAGYATNAGDADTTDGFHLNQDVRTTATPSFNGLNIGGSTVINTSGQWVGSNNPSYIRYCYYRYGKDTGLSEETAVAIPNDETAWPDQFCCDYANNLGSSNFWDAYLRKVYPNGVDEDRTCNLN